MNYSVYERLSKNKNKLAKMEIDKIYEETLKSIENDDVFLKLYNMTVQRYLDNDMNPNNITLDEIISLDLDYFKTMYGKKITLVRNKSNRINFCE